MSVSPGTVEVPLTRGKVAIVDAEDAGSVLCHSWQVRQNRKTDLYHARRAEPGPDGGQRYVYMHRQIIGAPAGVIVDHIDRDGLNNRRSNLRLCGPTGNARNRSIRSNNTSGFTGVYKQKNCSGWLVQVNGEYLGIYPSAEEAARAYDTAARRIFGEFARLNFPDDFRPVDPAISDLRPNNTSGYTGVIRVIVKGKVRWCAKIQRGGIIIHVGTFKSPEEAAAAREARLALILSIT